MGNYDMSRALASLAAQEERKGIVLGGEQCPKCRRSLARKGETWWCGHCGFSREVERYVFPVNECTLATVNLGDWKYCVYCGDPPSVRDHMIPRSMYAWGGTSSSRPGPKVIACQDCNARLHARFLPSLTWRCLRAQDYIRSNFHRVLRSADWSKQEIAKMDRNLQSVIAPKTALRLIVEKRLAWQDSQAYQTLREKITAQVLDAAPRNVWLQEFTRWQPCKTE